MALAGVAGTLLRYWIAGWTSRRYGESFPWGTLAVNLTGCFMAGALFHLLTERFAAGETTRAALFVGLLGAFTTFSTYGLQTPDLLRDGRVGPVLLNVGLSNALGIVAPWGGYELSRAFGGTG